jgi:hypothetical protein
MGDILCAAPYSGVFECQPRFGNVPALCPALRPAPPPRPCPCRWPTCLDRLGRALMRPQQAPPGCKFACQNAQGLTPFKALAALSWLREQHFDGGLFFETQTPLDIVDLLQHEPGAGVVWPGAQFFSVPGTGHTAGVWIVLGPSCSGAQALRFDGPNGQGRVLRVDLLLMGKPVCLVAAYGPTLPSARTGFFTDVLRPFLPADGRPLLLAADFNVVLSDLDCVYPPGHAAPVPNTRLAGAPALTALMETFGLVDIWREAHVGARAHTHWSAAATSGGRLDRWLVSASLLGQFAASSSIVPASGFPSDHLPVSLHLSSISASSPRGRGLQGFPLLLLNLPAAHGELAALVHVQAAGLLACSDVGIVERWDRMKEVLRAASWEIYRRHRRQRQLGATAAVALAAQARQRLLCATEADDFGALCAAVRDTAEAATRAWLDLCSPANAAAATLDHIFGDSSSYYFHQLARVPPPPTVIHCLQQPGLPFPDPDPADLGTLIGVQRALDHCAAFYSSNSALGLFRARHDIHLPAQDALLKALPRLLPQSHASLAEGLDGDSLLAPEDMDLALQLSNRGSVPGIDGLPYEFYRAFQADLVPVLCRVFNGAFCDDANPAPLQPLLGGVICLLLKPGQPADTLLGYRPITLLNCDVKLVMLVLSNRLQRSLDYVIDITQSAFLRGRDITDNVRYHLGLTARLQELGLPGWLLHSDLTKAYDTADRGWLLRTMAAMGFKPAGVVRWCALLMAGTHSRVRLNGFLSIAFPTAAGIPQGGSLSCQKWVIILEPCIAYLNSLQAGGAITGFRLPNGEPAPAACAFADDTKLFVHDPERDGPVIRDAFALAARAGLPVQSVPKTKLLYLRGPVPPTLDPMVQGVHQATGFNLHPPAVPHRLLGVPFCPDEALCRASAFAQQSHAMRSASAPWLPLRISLLGRSHIAMQCLASKAVFQANFRPPPTGSLKAMQQAVNGFVATSARPEEETPFPGRLYPKFAVAALPTLAGGLGVPHLMAHMLAMQAKAVWLLFRHSSHPWLGLFQHEVVSASVASPGRSSGLHTLVSAPDTLVLPPTCTPLVASAVAAFRKLGVIRVAAPEDQGLESVLLEHTFFNSPGPAWEETCLADLSSGLAHEWQRLVDVREAWLTRAMLSMVQRADLDLILSRLPHPWRALLVAPASPYAAWSALALRPSRGCLPLFLGPDPSSGQIELWELWPSGRLHALAPGAVSLPVGPSRPACVSLRPKDRTAWLRADYVFMAAQSLLPAGERSQLLEPWLVGVWADMDLDPAVWGIIPPHGEPVALLDLTVGSARHLLSHHSTMAEQGPRSRGYVRGYREAHAAWPKAWRLAPVAAPDPPLDQLGLAGLEERWRQSTVFYPLAAGPSRGVDWRIVGLHRQNPPLGRPDRDARDAARGIVDPFPPLLRPGFANVWKRLNDPTLYRPYRITCWQVLHGCLGCKAFLHHVRRPTDLCPNAPPPPPASLYCDAPGCSASHALETLTHAFVDCPEVAPVVDWLIATWALLTHAVVPRCPRVLLADDIEVWPGRPPDPGSLRLWTRLRVAVLGAIWQVRCSRDTAPGVSFARRVVRLAVQHIVDAIRRDWSRTLGDIRLADAGAFCVDWWRGVDMALRPEIFAVQWATPPLFCRIVGGPPQGGVPGPAHLEFLIGHGFPVPLPP